MKVLINGSKDFDDPLTFRRAMGVVMSDMSDSELSLYLTGAYKTSDIARQFVNLTEKSFAARGMRLTYIDVPHTHPLDDIDIVVVCVNPPAKNTFVGRRAEEQGKEVYVFRY